MYLNRPKKPLGWIASPLTTAFLSLCLAFSAAAQGTEDNLGTIYLNAYMMADEALKLEQQGNHAAAFRKNNDASVILNTIARDHPRWRREVVTYRRKKVNAAIERCRVNLPGVAEGTDRQGYSSPQREAYVPPPSVGGSTSQSLLGQKDVAIQKLQIESENLLRNLQGTQGDLERTKAELSRSRTAQETLLFELGTAKEKLAKSTVDPAAMKKLEADIKRLTNELAIANESLSASDKRNEKLTADLQQATEMVASLSTEREELQNEREQLDDLLNGARDSDVKKLLIENKALKKELAEARQETDKLTAEKKHDAEKISGLQERLAKVEGRLAELQQENTAYRDRITALSNKLRTTQDDLRQALSGPDGQAQIAQAALDENQALRQIVDRQIRQQEWRKQAKELLLEQMSEDQQLSRNLIDRIEKLGSGAVLTDEEMAMFKDSLLGPLGSGGSPDGVITDNGEWGTADYPELLGHNDGTRSPSGLNENLTEYARAIIGDFRRGDFVACEAGYAKILEITPSNIYAMRNLAIIKMRMGKPGEAESWLRKAIATETADDYSHFLLGVLYYRSDNDEQALAAIQNGLNIAPSNAKALHYIGAIYIKRGMREEARQAFEQVVSIDPTYGDAFYNLAYLYVTDKTPNLGLARQFYRKAIRNGTTPDAAMDRALGV